MHGWLVVNGYITNPKFLEIYQWLLEAGKKQGISLEKKTNSELLEELGKEQGILSPPDFVLFWDKDVRLAGLLEARGLRLFNRARSIALCDDKALTYTALLGSGIPMPKTWVAPKTFDPAGYQDRSFFEAAARDLGYPLVVKECFGSFGRQVYLAVSREELWFLLDRLGNRPFLLQEYIASSRGRDIRIQVVGEEAVACMYRYNQGDFRANITNGGRMKPYTPTRQQKEIARQACRTLGLAFAGVDLLFGSGEEPLLCEVNSNAHFKNIYDCTGVNTAEAILAHVQKEMAR